MEGPPVTGDLAAVAQISRLVIDPDTSPIRWRPGLPLMERAATASSARAVAMWVGLPLLQRRLPVPLLAPVPGTL
jgi:hypothetical protein